VVLFFFHIPLVVGVLLLVGAGVVWQEPVLGYASVIPISEGEMMLIPSWVDGDTIRGWEEPCLEG
jgi:hypothetical protein